MKLSHAQLDQFASGIDTSQIINQAWRPVRMPRQMTHIYEQPEGAKVRMLCDSGVRIRFESNTQSIKLGLSFGVRAREIFQSALIVDNGPTISFGPDKYTENWTGEIFQQPTKLNRQFDLWLPHMAQADILSLQLDDDATISPAKAPDYHWLCYGDSITQGMTAHVPTETHFARTCLALNMSGINLGIGGARLTADLQTSIPDGDYDVISIAYGTNDFNQDIPPETFKQNADNLIAGLSLKFAGKPIVLITPLTWADRTEPNKLGIKIEDYRTALEKIRPKYANVTLLGGETLIPNDPSYFVDKVHPNAKGFELYAAKLTETIRKVLKPTPA